MNNQKEFNKKLNQTRNNAILEICSWWGLGNAGYNGAFINSDKGLYTYQYYQKPDDKNNNYIIKRKELNAKEYNRVITFIENEILQKKFYDEKILDAGFDVLVNYNVTKKIIKNNKGLDNNPMIYDNTKKLIDELLK